MKSFTWRVLDVLRQRPNQLLFSSKKTRARIALYDKRTSERSAPSDGRANGLRQCKHTPKHTLRARPVRSVSRCSFLTWISSVSLLKRRPTRLYLFFHFPRSFYRCSVYAALHRDAHFISFFRLRSSGCFRRQLVRMAGALFVMSGERLTSSLARVSADSVLKKICSTVESGSETKRKP